MVTAGIVVVAVAALGIAVKHGLMRATPPVRTTYDSIFYVDLNLLVIAIIGGRIASDAQSNVFDLRATIDRVSKANLTLEETAEALRESEQQLIVMNLLTNASDAVGDSDGVIRLSTRCVKVDQDSESGDLDESNYTLLAVSGTGCGMTPETQAKVFDPFLTTKFAGHGLGLAIVEGIVRRLGGKIRLNSEPGKGTTFQILLPCALSPAEATVMRTLAATRTLKVSFGMRPV